MTRLRVGIVGAGAIGCALAHALAAAGLAKPAMLARGRTLAALRARGVGRIDGTEKFHRVRATDDPHELGPQDVLILSTKAHSLPALAPALRAMIGQNTTILPLVNGVPWWFFAQPLGAPPALNIAAVDPGGALSDAVPSRQIVGAVVNMSCESPEPGCVRRGRGNRITIGSICKDADQASRVKQVGSVLGAAGFDVAETDVIRDVVWFKLLGNASFNPISALTRATGDRIASDDAVRAVCVGMMGEMIAVGSAFGLSSKGSPDSRIAVAETLGAFKTSMLQDTEAGRPLEHEPLLGAVVEIADRFGVPVPTTRTIRALVALLNDVIVTTGLPAHVHRPSSASAQVTA